MMMSWVDIDGSCDNDGTNVESCGNEKCPNPVPLGLLDNNGRADTDGSCDSVGPVEIDGAPDSLNCDVSTCDIEGNRV